MCELRGECLTPSDWGMVCLLTAPQIQCPLALAVGGTVVSSAHANQLLDNKSGADLESRNQLPPYLYLYVYLPLPSSTWLANYNSVCIFMHHACIDMFCWLGPSHHVRWIGGRCAEHLEGKSSWNVDEKIVSVAETSWKLCHRFSGKA